MVNKTIAANGGRDQLIIKSDDICAILFDRALVAETGTIILYQGNKRTVLYSGVLLRAANVMSDVNVLQDQIIDFGTTLNLRENDYLTVEITNNHATDALFVSAKRGVGAQAFVPVIVSYDLSSTNHAFNIGSGVKRVLLSAQNASTNFHATADKVTFDYGKSELDAIVATNPPGLSNVIYDGADLNDLNVDVLSPAASSYLTVVQTLLTSEVLANYVRRTANHAKSDSAQLSKLMLN